MSAGKASNRKRAGRPPRGPKSVRSAARRHAAQDAADPESWELYRALVDASPDAIAVHAGGRFLYANAAALRMYGAKTFEDLSARTVLDLPPPSDRELTLRRIRFTEAGGTPKMREGVVLRLDGVEVPVEIHAVPVRYRGGPAVLTFLRDISDRKRLEARMQGQHAVIRAVNGVLGAALTSATEEELGRACLAAAEELTESQSGFVGEINAEGRLDDIAISDPGWLACRTANPIGHRILPAGLEVHGIYGRVLKDGAGFFTNDPSSHPDSIGTPPGHPPLTAFLGVPLLHEGKTIGMIGLANREGGYRADDLDAMEAFAVGVVQAFMSRRAEEALRRSEAGYRNLFESMTQGVVYQDAEGRVISANPAAEQMLGLSLDQMRGRTSSDPRWRSIREDGSDFPGEEHPAMVALRTGNAVRDVIMGIFNPTMDEYRWLKVDGVPQFRPGEEKPYQVYTLFDDITERKRARDALKRSQERFSSLYSSMTEGVALHEVVYDESGEAVDYVILDVNPAFERIIGLSREAVVGRRASEAYGTGSPPYLEIYAAVAASGKSKSFETYFPPLEKHFGISVFSPGKGRFATVFRDISDRKRAEEESREAREYLENLFNYANAPIIVWDPNLKITRFNRAFERLTGRLAEDMIGRELDLLFPERAREQSLALIRRAMTGERWETVEIPIQSIDGSVHTVLWNSATLYGGDGMTPVATIAQGQDITTRKLIEEERQELLVREREARREAEAANRAKDEFLAVLSHELRTPLTAILGWVKMLESGRLGETHSKRGLEIIERNVKAQTRLIEDLLDVSRIIAGKLTLEKTVVDLAAIVQATTESLRPAAEDKEVQLIYRAGASSVPFEGDPARLEQVVWNLVSNAIKFTPEGGRVDVGLSTPNGKAIITVADTGIGMKPEFLPRLFARFSQADGSTTRQYTGLGLGLAIVRSIVELHGGTVEARSEGVGRGATFTVTLPLSAEVGPPERPEWGAEPIEATMPLQGLRVLFVEDDNDFRELGTDILQMAGATVDTAASAPEALSAFKRSRPDVLVSDIGLPLEDGYSLMRKIRVLEKEQGARPVPAIALTGYAQVDDHSRVHEAGFDQHIAKPVEPGVLIGVIASIARHPNEDRRDG